MNKHLGSNERYQIQIGLAQGLPVSVIAQGIGYRKSTLYHEIANNRGGAGYAAKFPRADALVAHATPLRLQPRYGMRLITM